jgi:hypothetical protein
MLMQNFKTAAELEISEKEKSALVKTLVLLETGKLKHTKPKFPRDYSVDTEFSGLFNMSDWFYPSKCGTVACIGGTAELVGNMRFEHDMSNAGLSALFYMDDGSTNYPMEDVTTEQAARALRNYLTTGKPDWRSILGK